MNKYVLFSPDRNKFWSNHMGWTRDIVDVTRFSYPRDTAQTHDFEVHESALRVYCCQNCGRPASFVKMYENMPDEGERCQVCNRWMCADCLDEDLVCEGCSDKSV